MKRHDYFDMRGKDANWVLRLDPNDFSIHLLLNTDRGTMELHMTIEQLHEGKAKLLGISEEKMQALTDLLSSDEDLAQLNRIRKKFLPKQRTVV